MPKFEKGDEWAGNALGRPRIPDEIKRLRAARYEEFLRSAFDIASLSRTHLAAFMAHPDTPIIQLTLARCLIEAADGSAPHMRLVWDRLYGAASLKEMEALIAGIVAGAAAQAANRPLEDVPTEKLIQIHKILQSPDVKDAEVKS